MSLHLSTSLSAFDSILLPIVGSRGHVDLERFWSPYVCQDKPTKLVNTCQLNIILPCRVLNPFFKHGISERKKQIA